MLLRDDFLYDLSLFLATKDGKHRAVTGVSWMLAGALLCTFAGIVASVVLTNLAGL